jgi:zinc transporter ZupT
MIMLMRGAWLVGPVAIVYVFLTSNTPWADLMRGAAVVGLVMVGGGVSGLVYGVVGRHLRTAFPGGRILAGIVTIAPYTMLLPLIERFIDRKALFSPLTKLDLGVIAGMALVFGSLIGYSWFAPEVAKGKSTKRPT